MQTPHGGYLSTAGCAKAKGITSALKYKNASQPENLLLQAQQIIFTGVPSPGRARLLVTIVNGTSLRFSAAFRSSLVSLLPHFGQRAEKILNFDGRFRFMRDVGFSALSNRSRPLPAKLIKRIPFMVVSEYTARNDVRHVLCNVDENVAPRARKLLDARPFAVGLVVGSLLHERAVSKSDGVFCQERFVAARDHAQNYCDGKKACNYGECNELQGEKVNDLRNQ
jgi:hypothetical protein